MSQILINSLINETTSEMLQVVQRRIQEYMRMQAVRNAEMGKTSFMGQERGSVVPLLDKAHFDFYG